MSNPNQIVVSQVNDVTIVEITTAGPQGETGAQGIQGIQGPDGTATVSIGTTTTGNAGTDASVSNTGTGTAAVLNFTIPRGATGATGATGPAGADGNDGATGATGPQGPQGIQGPAGNDGSDGATGATGPQGIQGPAGSDGSDGAAATIAVGTVTTGAAGSSATVTNSGSSSAATFDFSIPKGDKGDTGDTGATGAQGAQGIQGIQGPAGNDGNDGSDATVNATNVDNAGAVMNSDLDGKGELLVGDGSGDPSALPVGTNGYVLKANSSTATGLEWSAAGSGGDVNQNAFSNVAVSGQDTVAADSTTDTLNIAAGSNVTITTNASNDTVTIASTDTNTTYSVGDGGLTQNNFTDTLKTKLDGIEGSATADQTDAEIKTAYENNSDTNAFTDAEKTKLSGVEASATADQTGSEIKSLYEGESDTNAFTDSEKTKLSGIEASADVTDATNVASAGAVMDGDFTSNGFMKRTGAGSYTVDTNTYLTSVPSGYLQNLSEDSSPQLGGDLDMNSNSISSGVLGIKNTGSQSELRLYCESNNAHYVSIKAPPHAQFSGNHTFQLPPDGGTNNYVLKTDGSGNTSWVAQTAAYTNTNVDSHLNVSSASSGQILSWNGSDYAWVADQTGGGGGGINNLVEDTTPQLGGNLDMQANNITGTGTITATSVASSANGMRKITTSTSSPSGGADGDIWIKYTA